ncbi:MAG: glycosyltransferase family 2 protein [Deltaproteobacteria bacterium]|nr:glycosyltransferase family 2 protein [Deltaproteobacteria bacterium]
MSPRSKISALIVTKDGAPLIKRLLNSVIEDTELLNDLSEIVIFDNGSKDNTEEVVKGFDINIKYIRSAENLGFSKAVNLSAASAKGDYFLLLNSDVILPKGEILKLKKIMDENDDVAVCGPALVYPDGSPQRSYSHIPSLLNEIIPRFIYELLFLKRSLQKINIRFFDHPVYSTSALIGACLLIRKKTFQTLNGFDERFFFFLEETDFCVRVKKNGHLVLYVPAVKVIHDQGVTVRKVWMYGKTEYNISLVKFINKHHRKWYVKCFIFCRFFKTLMIVLSFLLAPFLLFSSKKRISFLFHIRLLMWFLKGLPDDYGLKKLNKLR